MVSLAVTPANLPVMTGRLRGMEFTLSTVTQASQAASSPHAPGGDDVSLDLAASFAAYRTTFYTPVNLAANNWQQGADVLGPVSVAYESTDIEGGVTVARHGREFDI